MRSERWLVMYVGGLCEERSDELKQFLEERQRYVVILSLRPTHLEQLGEGAVLHVFVVLELLLDFVLVRLKRLHHLRALGLLYTKRHERPPNKEREKRN